MRRTRFLTAAVAAVLAVLFVASSAFACTVMGVGKDASADGSTMVSHTCDGWYDNRIIIIPGGDHAEGEMVEIYNDPCLATRTDPVLVGEIPQAAHTYTYFHTGYPFMNEKQLMISEFTWSGRSEMYNSNGMLVIANLQELGLARAATAREAVQIMGELAEKYGYCDGGECLIIADPNEVWVFEVCGPGPLWTSEEDGPGAHWAARRVPDDQVFFGANRSRLGVIDFNDTENYMWSTNITAFPEAMEWWSEGEEFNYTNIFNPTPYGYEFYASRREWRILNLICPSQEWEVIARTEAYPFTVTPDEKVTVEKIMREVYSDHLEGTEYDLTTGLAAGPFHNPTRWGVQGSQKPEAAASEDWERSIATYRCSYSMVTQSRSWLPDPVGGLLWFGEDCPDTTVYVPIYCGVTEVPVEWTENNRKGFDPDSAWWAFNLVNNWANLRWDTMYEEIRAKKFSYEDEFFAKQAEIEAEAVALYEEDPAKAVEFLTNYTCESMTTVEEGWWEFAWYLIGKYYDGGMINEEGRQVNVGYPTDWLEAVGFGETSLADKAELGVE